MITAGASGIGLAITRCFRAAGAAVTVWDIDADALAKLAVSDPGIVGVCVDVGDPDAVDANFARIDRIDTLVNNAGIGGGRGPIETIDNDDWARRLRSTCRGRSTRSSRTISASTPSCRA